MIRADAARYGHATQRGSMAMGKGDKKSFRGKVWRSSYGNTRPHKKGPKRKG
jgi:ribosomal small subunit protein bTHX